MQDRPAIELANPTPTLVPSPALKGINPARPNLGWTSRIKPSHVRCIAKTTIRIKTSFAAAARRVYQAK